ncbi:MAG: sulfatase-like hydrolase/transferase [Planctomycetes bacterium]|nr:sulfatase-like hydrolase/transferase [Planctomycetota bacterium]
MRRALSLLLPLLAAAAVWWGMTSTSRMGAHAAPRGGAVDGIVVLCVDTFRADALDGADGAPPPMPFLGELAAQGTRFTDALAPTSWTGPSIASMLTGLVPLRHGVTDPAGGARLPPNVATVGALLRAAGWHTAAYTGGGWAGAGSGLSGGFDRFDEDFDRREPEETLTKWRGERPAGRPFFLFLHTYAAHDPYGTKAFVPGAACSGEPYERGRALAATMAQAKAEELPALRRQFLVSRLTEPCSRMGVESILGRRGAWDLWQSCLPWMEGGWRETAEDRAVVDQLHAAYRAQLPTVDRFLARVVAAVERVVPARTALLVVADHGEAFGEHGVLYHGLHITQELVQVPLILRAPGVPAGATVDAACGVVDVAPTLLELAGVPAPEGLDGRSLLALAAGRDGGRAVESFLQPIDEGAGLEAGRLRRVAVRDDDVAWVAAYDPAARAWVDEVWYDRRRDPLETTPLRAAPPGATAAGFATAWAAARARVEYRYAPEVGDVPAREGGRAVRAGVASRGAVLR